MTRMSFLSWPVACVLATVATTALAQVPGEDPVVLNRKLLIQMLPLGSQTQSNAPSLADDMPAWQRARTARHEARAFARDKAGVITDQDVINTVNTNGGKTACVQSVGSTVSASPIKGGKDQVVVVRGDLVNICH